MKNANAPAVKREAEEDWGGRARKIGSRLRTANPTRRDVLLDQGRRHDPIQNNSGLPQGLASRSAAG
jgi:hypothetical protein